MSGAHYQERSPATIHPAEADGLEPDQFVTEPIDLGIPIDDEKVAQKIEDRKAVEEGYFRDDYPDLNQERDSSPHIEPDELALALAWARGRVLLEEEGIVTGELAEAMEEFAAEMEERERAARVIVGLFEQFDASQAQLAKARRVVEASRVPASWISREGALIVERDMDKDWQPLFRDLTSALADYDASYPPKECDVSL